MKFCEFLAVTRETDAHEEMFHSENFWNQNNPAMAWASSLGQSALGVVSFCKTGQASFGIFPIPVSETLDLRW